MPESIPSDFCACKNCGAVIDITSEADYPREARLRIEELEQQVKEFSVRAVMAAERLAQAQKEIFDLRRKSEPTTSSTVSSSSTSSVGATPQSPLQRSNTVTATLQSTYKASTQKINQLFAYRTATATTEMPPPVERPPTPPEALARASMESQALDDLSNALCQERRQRQIAEQQLSAVKNELEELSATLFQQANEMVSVERKARAKLEDKLQVVEKRDQEKRVRLETLEQGFERIIRVRGLLGNNMTTPTQLPARVPVAPAPVPVQVAPVSAPHSRNNSNTSIGSFAQKVKMLGARPMNINTSVAA
ncbi:hypothetical protein ABW20_dc0110536 [Dactylellina cionopaga]|nr:hypothetical protein ABW20_dc0110536 [Dactylellina cionopaga]